MRRRKFVWEEEDEDDGNEEQQRDAYDSPDASTEQFEQIQLRIGEMAASLSTARQEVDRLKVSLRSQRELSARRLRESEYGWRRKLEDFDESISSKAAQQEALVRQLREDSQKLESRLKSLLRAQDERPPRSSQSLKEELAANRAKMREAWKAREQKELEKEMERKAGDIKASVAAALEPELHRLIKDNRRELLELRAEAASAVDEKKKALERSNAERLAEFKAAQAHREECEVAKVREKNAAIISERRVAIEKSIEEISYACFEDLRRAKDKEREELDAEHARAIRSLQQDIGESEDEDVEEEAWVPPTLAAFEEKREMLIQELSKRFCADVEDAEETIREKMEKNLIIVLHKLEEDAEAERVEFARTLQEEKRFVEDQNADAVASLKSHEIAAMELYLGTADRENELKDDLRKLEDSNAKIRAEIVALEEEISSCENAERSFDDDVEAALAELRKDHKQRCAVVKGRIVAAHTSFDETSEEIESLLKEHCAATEEKKREYESELAEIDVKIQARLEKKRKKRDSLILQLTETEERNSKLDADINAKRLVAHLNNSS